MEAKHYKIKTQRMCKVYSQGLLMPLSLFPEIGDVKVNTDVTQKLDIKYAVAEDNVRKRNQNKEAKYNAMAARHKRLFKTKLFRRLIKTTYGKKILFLIFGKKKDKPLEFPAFVKKTDEERIENCPWHIGDGKKYVLTESWMEQVVLMYFGERDLASLNFMYVQEMSG